MATVLLAEDERLGRKVAVKRLHAETPEDTERRFRREAKLQAALNHPNLVAIYDTHADDEGVLIVMEYVDGETLRDTLARGPLEPQRALEVLRGVAAALDHAHEEGIVHRDVKPANVLLGRDGRVKLADLGIATAVEGTRITMSGTVLGTAAYMAPEALEGHSPGPVADVYSLAVVAWESLSGKRAYDGTTPLQIAHRKAVDPPPNLLEAWPEAPASVALAIARAMDPDPTKRPASPGAFVDELAQALEEGERTPVPAPAPEPPRREAQRWRPPPPSVAEPLPEPVQERAAPPPPPQHPAYARHSASRGRPSWLVPLIALLAVAAGVAVLLVALGTGGSDSPPSKSAKSSGSTAAQKKQSASKDDTASSSGTPAPSTDSSEPDATAPAPADDGGSGSGSGSYEVPQPTGSDPAEAKRLNSQGKALTDSGKYDEAIPVLERAVRSASPGSSDLTYAFALFNLGHALREAGRPDDAIPVLEQRLKIDNQRATVQRELDAARAEAGSG